MTMRGAESVGAAMRRLDRTGHLPAALDGARLLGAFGADPLSGLVTVDVAGGIARGRAGGSCRGRRSDRRWRGAVDASAVVATGGSCGGPRRRCRGGRGCRSTCGRAERALGRRRAERALGRRRASRRDRRHLSIAVRPGQFGRAGRRGGGATAGAKPCDSAHALVGRPRRREHAGSDADRATGSSLWRFARRHANRDGRARHLCFEFPKNGARRAGCHRDGGADAGRYDAGRTAPSPRPPPSSRAFHPTVRQACVPSRSRASRVWSPGGTVRRRQRTTPRSAAFPRHPAARPHGRSTSRAERRAGLRKARSKARRSCSCRCAARSRSFCSPRRARPGSRSTRDAASGRPPS